MAEVHLIRISSNPQIKSFQQTELPAVFWANDEDGRKREYKFKDATGREAPFVIDRGGSMKLFTERQFVSENVEALKAMLRTPGLIPPGAEFKLVDLQEEATDNAAKRSKRIKALVEIQKMEHDQQFIASLARRLGMNGVPSVSFTEVLDYVQQRAEEDADKVLEILGSVYQEELFEFDKAKEAGIIQTRNGFFMYGQIQLGISEGSVISYFHKHPDVFADIVLQNQSRYGSSMQEKQEAKIRAILEGTKIPVETSYEAKPVQDETVIDDSTRELLNEARQLLVITKEDGEEFLSFRHIELMGGTGIDGHVQNALYFLQNKKNAQVRKAVGRAIEQARKEKDKDK